MKLVSTQLHATNLNLLMTDGVFANKPERTYRSSIDTCLVCSYMLFAFLTPSCRLSHFRPFVYRFLSLGFLVGCFPGPGRCPGRNISIIYTYVRILHHELVNGPLDGLNETGELLVLIRGDARSNDRPGYTASPAKSSLGSDEDVRDVLANSSVSTWSYETVHRTTHLLFAKEREVKQNLQRLGISSQDDNFCDTTVQGLRGCRHTSIGCAFASDKSPHLHWLPSSAACTG